MFLFMVFKYNKMHTMLEKKIMLRMFLFSFLGRWPVYSNHYCVISLVWFQCYLFLRLHLLRLHLLHLPGEHGLSLCSGVDTVSLDRDDKMSPILQEILRIECHYPSLVGLGHISKNTIHHGYKHTIFVGVSGIFNDGNHISPLLGNIEEIPARPVTKLHCVHHPLRSHNIRHVTYSGAASSSQIQNLTARGHVYLIYPS